MNRDKPYFDNLLAYAHNKAGSYRKLAKALGATSGPAVQMWRVNGVPHKWRTVLDKKFGPTYRKSLKELIV